MTGIIAARRIVFASAAVFAATLVAVFPAWAEPDARPSYLVFFDFEVPNLTAQAVETVAAAIARAKQEGAKSIYLVGYADGAEHHPERLSFKRARAAREILVRGGIDSEITIAVQGRGFYKPLVDTREREPQNCFVAIYIGVAPPGH